MQKTLLDEFAMAVLNGLLASWEQHDVTDHADLATESYQLAAAMMAERAKRMSTPESAEPLSQASSPAFAMSSQLIDSVAHFKGRKVTCTDLFQHAYGQLTPTMDQLREVGAILRSRGYQKVRSGGKDYYQL